MTEKNPFSVILHVSHIPSQSYCMEHDETLRVLSTGHRINDTIAPSLMLYDRACC